MENTVDTKVQTTTHLGWQKDDSFLPGLSDFQLVDKKGESIYLRFDARGTLDDWKHFVRKGRESAGSRLALAASFAAPLLKLEDCRTFGIHFNGPTQDGANAAFELAASVWMNPRYATANFDAYSPDRGMEKDLTLHANLPVFITSRNISDRAAVDPLVKLIRADQDGKKWRTVIMTTDRGVLDTNLSVGQKNIYFMEPYFEHVIDDINYVVDVYYNCYKYYGTAGPEFIEKAYDDEDRYGIMMNWWEHLRAENINDTHRAYLSLIATADQLSSQYFWNQGGNAVEETKIFLEQWVEALQVTEDVDLDDGPQAFWGKRFWMYA